MKCIMCDNPKDLKERPTTIKYKQSGLDNITLQGVHGAKCDRCGEEYYNFGDLEKLNAKIADVLILKKGRLNGKELRFLRTYLGYSGTLFAQLTGYKKETISRFENGKEKINLTLDRLVRSLVTNKLPDRNYEIHDQWLENEEKSYNRIVLGAKANDWQIISAA